MLRGILRNAAVVLLVFGIWLLPTDCHRHGQQDLLLLADDDAGVTVEVSVPTFERVPVEVAGKQSEVLSVDGWARTAAPGLPELPFRSFLIQVPAGGALHARVLEREESTLPGCRIAPVPTWTRSEDGTPHPVRIEDAAAYGGTSLTPEKRVEVGPRQTLRGVPVARVSVFPFRWNPATGLLHQASRLVVRVDFASTLPEAPSPPEGRARQASDVDGRDPFGRLLAGTLLNDRGAPLAPSADPADGSDPPSSPGSGLRIEVDRCGIYRLPYEVLAAHGLELDSPETFQLFNQGEEVAIRVVSGPHFGPGDHVEFHACGIDTPFTGRNVYWFVEGREPGRRVAEMDGRPTGTGTRVAFFRDTLREEENHSMWEQTPGSPDQDYWFWTKLTAPDTWEHVLEVPAPVDSAAGAFLRIAYQGRSTAAPHPDHHTRVLLNGEEIADDLWDGDAPYVQEAPLAAGRLLDGPNTIVVEAPGDTGSPVDLGYVNRVELEYARRFEARDDRLAFTVNHPGRIRIEITGFTGPDILLYETTDPLAPRRVIGFQVDPVDTTYTVAFEADIEGARSFLALAEGAVAVPEALSFWQDPGLADEANGADYLVVTSREMLPAVSPLCDLHRSSGLRVASVAVEDVYNTFSHGIVDPAAIRSFLSHAYAHWTPPAPAYVLLAGDANTDYRDYMQTGKRSIVPTLLTFTPGFGLTPDDNAYACLEGDDVLPELYLGRITGSDPEALAQTVEKLVGFATSGGPPPQDVLFVADDETGFEALNDSLQAYLPPDVTAREVYLGRYGTTEEATQAILTEIDRGVRVTNYVGHAAVTNWAGEYLFQSSDVSRLPGGHPLTFTITLDCLNGYFSHPSYACLAEAFVSPPDRGAVASFSPTGLGYLWEHKLLGHELFSRMFEEEAPRLGPLTTASRIAAFGEGVSEACVRMFTLIGDPALRLHPGPAVWEPAEPPEGAEP